MYVCVRVHACVHEGEHESTEHSISRCKDNKAHVQRSIEVFEKSIFLVCSGNWTQVVRLAWQALLSTKPSFWPFALVFEVLNELAAQYFSSVVCLASSRLLSPVASPWDLPP